MLHVLSGEVIQLVKVLRIRTDDDASVRFLDVHDCLEHDPVAILNELAH